MAWAPSLIALIHVVALAAVIFVVGYHWRGRARRHRVERVLFQELVSLRRQAVEMAAEIERRHRAGEGFDLAFFNLWRLSPPLLYPAMGAALAVLPGGTLDRIGYFHAQLADARARLSNARTAGGFEPTPYRMLSCLVRAISHVDPWYEGVGRTLGNVEPWEPDLAGASALLGSFEDAAQEPLVLAYYWADCAEGHPAADDAPAA
ncbi:hypothetical protein ACFOMD_01090 [Sphingoaurantiacus capsulatus]|uniref:Uncharacterized protein n=1 Tax=Sphingoaurantiacus capsulatus TaxID=1771310 RepID=A0ABV7X4R1_9SPHN